MGIDRPPVSRIKLVLAFAAIYILWGSTYLAIRVAIDTVPPFLMAGGRFLAAGGILYAWSVWQGVSRPTGRQWRNAALAGIPLFVMGNGGVTWAELTVPSGLAALVVATLPAWLLLFDWSWGGRRGPGAVEAVGIILGLVGVVVLAAPRETGAIPIVGILVLVGATVAWAVGSLFNRYADLPKSPVQTAGLSMLSGGVVLTVLGFGAGEWGHVHVEAVSRESILAIVYLVAVALVALPAYTWLLTATSPALVGTYAFVNPVVAVLLGSLVLNEALDARAGLAVLLVVAGVGLLTWPKRKPGRSEGTSRGLLLRSISTVPGGGGRV